MWATCHLPVEAVDLLMKPLILGSSPDAFVRRQGEECAFREGAGAVGSTVGKPIGTTWLGRLEGKGAVIAAPVLGEHSLTLSVIDPSGSLATHHLAPSDYSSRIPCSGL